MESVATSLEGPVKLLSPRAAVRQAARREEETEGERERGMCPPLEATAAPGQCPFSILGLGDIVMLWLTWPSFAPFLPPILLLL